MQTLSHVLSAALSLAAIATPSPNAFSAAADRAAQANTPRSWQKPWDSVSLYAPQSQSIVSQLGDGSDCVPLSRSETPASAEPAATPRPGEKGWDERYRDRALDLSGSSLAYCERFQRNLSLNGPILWAKQHADVGKTTFDPPGGKAYSFSSGTMKLTAYAQAGSYRGANVQSTSANQAYQGHAVIPRTQGFTCAGCYWEARIKFPSAYGTWGSFWLLTPDNPRDRGHLEVDVIEYYGLQDRRGHHHAIHSWRNGSHLSMSNDYTGMDAIADSGFHTYGVDLRGVARLNGKPALVIYMDGREVGRIAADTKYYSDPFYFLTSLTLNPKETRHTVPQTMEVDYVMAYRPVGGR